MIRDMAGSKTYHACNMIRCLAMLITFLVLGLQTALAQCLEPLSAPRNAAALASMVETGDINPDMAERLAELVARRQGIAARALELQYTVGKTASSSPDAEKNQTIALPREQATTNLDRTAFIDAEMTALLHRQCSQQ